MKCASLVVAVLLGLSGAEAYEVRTHDILSREAALQSVLGDQEARSRLGLRHPIDFQQADQMFLGSKGVRSSIIDLIGNGAVYEDDFPPGPIYHFFDPRTNLPLHINPADYPSAVAAYVNVLNSKTRTSPDWVVQGQGSFPFSSNDYSFPKARDYFYRGLTSSINEERQGNLGLLFESLGRMIHHIEDMAQPQHVRNDNHLSNGFVDQGCDADADATGLCATYFALRRESAYEGWTNRPDILAGLPLVGYEPVYPGIGLAPDGIEVFTTPRQFWANAGKGIAEYTNRNFFSEGTMNESPPFTDVPFDVDVRTLCATANPSCEIFAQANEYVTFFPSYVDDRFRPGGGPTLHNFAAVESIFNPEFTSYTAQLLRSVNRFTFAKDYEFLIPRAVGYSAGLINYFFRGSMEITLPDEGMYSIVDHSPSGCGNPCAFRKLKLRLKNVTPGNGQFHEEQMGDANSTGNLWVVAKYHLNMCYRPSLSGEDGGDDFHGNGCRSANEYVSVSAAHPVNIVSADQPQQLIFDFSAKPIPVNASDVFLQVVFRGRLGPEIDAVAVTTKDVAETNFFGFSNMSDYAYDDSDSMYHRVPFQDTVTSKDMTNIRLQFDGGAGAPVATMPLLSGGQHAQVAYLADVGQTSLKIQYDYLDQSNVVYQRQEPVFEFTADNDTGPYTRTCPVKKLRGLYREDLFFVWQPVHGAVSWTTLDYIGKAPLQSGTIRSDGDGRLNPKASPGGSICITDARLTGIRDFSAMTVQTIDSALNWNINF